MKNFCLFIVFLYVIRRCESGIFNQFFKRIGNGILKDHQHQLNTPYKKLATTPLFYVCTSRGQAYLQDDVQSGDTNQKTTVHFMSSEDATSYLEGMAQANNQQASEFRIMSVSMEKVLNQIHSKKQSRKWGRYPSNIAYRIQASTRQIDNVNKLQYWKPSIDNNNDIPMFSTNNLAIKRANGKVVIPYYFCYEDLKEDYDKLEEQSKSDGTLLPILKPTVRSFTDIMCLSKGIDSKSLPELNNINKKSQQVDHTSTDDNSIVGIIPPRREIEMLRSFYSGKIGLPNEYEKTELK